MDPSDLASSDKDEMGFTRDDLFEKFKNEQALLDEEQNNSRDVLVMTCCQFIKGVLEQGKFALEMGRRDLLDFTSRSDLAWLILVLENYWNCWMEIARLAKLQNTKYANEEDVSMAKTHGDLSSVNCKLRYEEIPRALDNLIMKADQKSTFNKLFNDRHNDMAEKTRGSGKRKRYLTDSVFRGLMPIEVGFI